ncbi:DsbA family protein [Pseudoclavibacter sp. 13-3]|uniref:DsbA family protein n=1 Tax=Pseudoclavibacter sp. 13-3 TaxID=2901228 RepID=UPI001E2C91CB|nr:thioredoxin domain-containing protein [Pseudoclavibacter sp. 13-3]MCD7100846.1 DsbA family protein [Pseudoclavibacter sp. 13-3]
MPNSSRTSSPASRPNSKNGRRPAAQTIDELSRRLRRSHIVNAVLSIVLAIAVVAVIALAAQQTSGQTPQDATQTTQADRAARHQADDPMAVGDIDAPVTIVEWIDLRCPFCAAYANQTLPTILQNYVDTGKVRYEFHDVAFFGDQSVDAAVAARAAGEQGRYVEYLEALYAAAPESGHPDMPRDHLIAFAQTAKVPDIDRFTADLDRADLREAVQQSTTDAQQQGIDGVPGFLIGDKSVSGAQPAAAFSKIIDQQLQAAGQ